MEISEPYIYIACSHRRHGQDKTFSISKFSVVLNIFETEQLQIGNLTKLIETGSRQDLTVWSCRQCVHTADADNTRQQICLYVSWCVSSV